MKEIRIKPSDKDFKKVDTPQRHLHLQTNKHLYHDLRQIYTPELERQVDIELLKDEIENFANERARDKKNPRGS